MVISLWCAAALIAFTYVGYPLLMLARARFAPRPVARSPIAPSVSIILAVYNGAERIEAQVRRLLSLDYDPALLDLIIVSDGSSDATPEILKRLQGPRLSSVCLPRGGKALALNAAVERAQGEILLFVDIRPEIEKEAVKLLVSSFADHTVGCVAGELCLREQEQAGATSGVGFYWRYEQALRNAEAAVDSPLGVYGGFYAMRRALFTPLPAGLILDDMFQPLNVVRQGYRSVVDARARVWDQWPSTGRGEFQRKVRTLAGNYQLIQECPWLLAPKNRLLFEFFWHKVMRLLVPVLMVLCLGLSVALWRHPVYRVLAVAQVIFYGLAAIGGLAKNKAVRKVCALPSAFCLLNAAVVVATVEFLRGGDLLRLWAPTSGAGTGVPAAASRAAAGAER